MRTDSVRISLMMTFPNIKSFDYTEISIKSLTLLNENDNNLHQHITTFFFINYSSVMILST